MVLANPLGLQLSSTNSTGSLASSSLTWEVGTGGDFGCVSAGCFTPLDPAIGYTTPIESILSNVYEPLVWYNGSSSTQVVPWLADSYTASGGGTVINFTLRAGITFADGQPLNSSAVFFSLNRLLIEDGNSPFGNGNGPSWTLQQLLNTSLSTALGGPQSYSPAWVTKVLAQDFVQVDGPLAFTIHVLHPTASLPYLLAEPWSAIVDPSFVMAHDLALWAAPNSTYREQNLLPYPVLGGPLMNRMIEYFKDEAATCGAGSTPAGCAITYLDSSVEGSLAGTGPYTIQSVSVNRSVILQARDGYWGGPYQSLGGGKITPSIRTVLVRNVPLQSDRTRDLARAAIMGNATIIDLDTSLDSTRLFDVVNQTDWVDYGRLVPTLPDVTVDGPFTSFEVSTIPFVTNVTIPSGGNTTSYAPFQPFADQRFRLAFADAADLYSISRQFNDLGQVATGAIPPGLPPLGSYNSSDLPRYRYDPRTVQDLLLSAMAAPITKFHLYNGTAAPAGLFNNTFGCARLAPDHRCASPVAQTITLTLRQGSPLYSAIMNQMASTINNVSQTYNMGLHVYVQTVATGNCVLIPGSCYMYPSGWTWDYPWAGDFVSPFFSPSPIGFMHMDGWNASSISRLWTQFENADSTGNVSGVVHATNELNAMANRETLYMWTYYPYSFVVHTSNLQGFSYNPSLYGQPFATLSLGGSSKAAPAFLAGYGPVAAAALTVSLALILGSLYIVRRRRLAMASQEGPLPVGGRRLAAIMFTDVVGYTALSQKDEALAMSLLEEHRATVRPFFPKHGGREVKTIGDAFLVEFGSALEAVRCAYDMQRSMREMAKGRPADRAVQLRIGVHLGDVIHSQNDVYGDAVNVASRIEPYAPPGGICLSEQVHDQVKNKFELPMVSIGRKELKNVGEAVEVFRVVLPWESMETAGLPGGSDGGRKDGP